MSTVIAGDIKKENLMRCLWKCICYLMCLQDKRIYITKRPLLERRDDSHASWVSTSTCWVFMVYGVIQYVLWFFFFLTHYPKPKPEPTLTHMGHKPFIYKLCKVKIYRYYYHCGDIGSPRCREYQDIHKHTKVCLLIYIL